MLSCSHTEHAQIDGIIQFTAVRWGQAVYQVVSNSGQNTARILTRFRKRNTDVFIKTLMKKKKPTHSNDSYLMKWGSLI